MRLHYRDVDRKTQTVTILLDGQPVPHCIEADSDEGWVLVHATDERGRIRVNEDETDTVRETLWGAVEIRISWEPSP